MIRKFFAVGIVALTFAACSDPSAPVRTLERPSLPSLSVNPPTTTAQTSTGYFYPLGTSSFYTGCPNNGGIWLGRDAANGGCYLSGEYHLGYDMFNSSTGMYSPAYIMATGTVIYVDPNSSWNLNGQPNNNTAVFVSSSTASGTNYVTVYGHLLRSTVNVQAGDVVTAGTQIGQIGYWTPDHVHIGIWPNYSSLPPSPWGMEPNYNWNFANNTTDPLAWITSSSSSAKCQNGGTVRYYPGGGTSVHPEGTLFTIENDPYHSSGTVYVLYYGQARPISSASVLYQLYGVGYGFDFRDIIQISSTEASQYPQGAVINSSLSSNGRNEPDGRLIQQWGQSEISIVTDGGYRRPFASADAFLNLGYQFCNVAGVSDYYNYPTESAITQ